MCRGRINVLLEEGFFINIEGERAILEISRRKNRSWI